MGRGVEKGIVRKRGDGEGERGGRKREMSEREEERVRELKNNF